MTTFTINDENNIVAYTESREAVLANDPTARIFSFEQELATLSTDWPMSRFVEIFNSIPGNSPVNKFTDKKKAVARVWKAIQPLAGGVATERQNVAGEAQVQPDAEKPTGRTRSAKKAKPAKATKSAKKAAKAHEKPAADRANKKAEVIAMMKRANGATLPEIMEHTGWQKHTVRGFVSILGSKGGEAIESSKNAAGDRVYKITK